MGALARCIRVLFPSFKFSAVLMAAYERTCPDGGDVNLKTLCKHLVYINNNLTVYHSSHNVSVVSAVGGNPLIGTFGSEQV